MAGNERYSLGQEIFEDLIGRNKFALLLLAFNRCYCTCNGVDYCPNTPFNRRARQVSQG